MALIETFSEALRRQLTAEEVELLRLLSPQGVAKVNADVAHGVNLEQTLDQLMVVYHATLLRRVLVAGSMPREMRSVVAQMRRPPTADEMVLFAEESSIALQHWIAIRVEKGEALEDVVQELAEEHRRKQMQREAQALANERGKHISFTQLSPTKLDPSDLTGLTMSVTELKQGKRLRVGPGPLTTWFQQSVQVNVDECDSICTVASQGSLSPRSALKKTPGRARSSLESSASTLGPRSTITATAAAAVPQILQEELEEDRPGSRQVSFGGSIEFEDENFPTAAAADQSRKSEILAALLAALNPVNSPRSSSSHATPHKCVRIPTLLRRLFTCFHPPKPEPSHSGSAPVTTE